MIVIAIVIQIVALIYIVFVIPNKVDNVQKSVKKVQDNQLIMDKKIDKLK